MKKKGKNKMSWQYGLVRKDDFLYLAEIYDKSSHTESIGFGGESPEAVIADLEIALSDLKKNLLVIDEIEFEDEKERQK